MKKLILSTALATMMAMSPTLAETPTRAAI